MPNKNPRAADPGTQALAVVFTSLDDALVEDLIADLETFEIFPISRPSDRGQIEILVRRADRRFARDRIYKHIAERLARASRTSGRSQVFLDQERFDR